MMRAKLLRIMRMLAVRGVVDFQPWARGTRILDDAPESESESGSDICDEEDMW